jgi:hypothetical protein
MNSIKSRLQEKLNYHFSFFIPVDFKGEIYRILPLKDQIPVIQTVNYTKTFDILEITFESKFKPKKEHNITENISYKIDDLNNIISIKIKPITEISRNRIRKNYQKRRLTETIKMIKYTGKPIDIVTMSNTKRKLNFIKDVIRSGIVV